MEKRDVVITYETLFELLKQERDRSELQKLEPSFFTDLVGYLREKRALSSQASGTSYEEKLKFEREMSNVHKLVKEIYDRRSKKVLMMALDQSKTKSNLVDFSTMIAEERDLYDKMITILDGFREGVLHSVLNEKLPSVYTHLSKKEVEQSKESIHKESKKTQDIQKEKVELLNQPEQTLENTQEGKEDPEERIKMVRFLHSVPKFVGPELEEYGPFSQDDIASLPKPVAEILLTKGRVEEINESA